MPRSSVSSARGQPTVPYDQCGGPKWCPGSTVAVASTETSSTSASIGQRHHPTGRPLRTATTTTSVTAVNTPMARNWAATEE